MEPGWYDLVGRLIEITPADEKKRMGEFGRKANTGVRRYGMRATVLIKIAPGKEEGSGYPDFSARPAGGQKGSLGIVGRRRHGQRTATQSHEQSVLKRSRQQLEDLERRRGVLQLGSGKSSRTQATARVLGWK